ncbi:PepSY-associated TM helix domain-containing protein [Oleiharenicola lentus]|uniref:PepSY-associated TM helix domain-containing protein n=1 Tax=Oleiharenicola lentus TaxID=2508720 RepID=UPI003F66619D
MKLFRKIFFWAHLVAGLIAGISIGIMCFTGAAIAFEGEIVAWTEREVRRVEVPSENAPRISLDELLKKVRELKPDARPSGITVLPDPEAAIAFNFGRDGAVYANPYTGELREPKSPNKAHDFLHLMEDWHRVLAMKGDDRATGKLINGICNIAFAFLAVSGLYLWWPRSWSWRSVKAIALFNFKFSGKARDFNWHNVIGLWSAPILIVLTLTAIPISFRWGGNLITRLSGEQVPVAPAPGQGGPGGFAAAPAVEVPRPAPGTRPASYDALLASVQKEIPEWSSIAFRLGAPTGRGGAGGGQRPQGGAPAQGNATPANAAPAPATTASAETSRQRPEGEQRRAGGEGAPRREGGQRAEGAARGEGNRGENARGGEGRGAGATAVSVAVREKNSYPRTATTTLTLNPYNGEVLKREGYADLTTSRQVRSWTRFLHTGQALGWIGQLVAGLACLGGCFLVYTGFALSWRRFFFKKKSASTAPAN